MTADQIAILALTAALIFCTVAAWSFGKHRGEELERARWKRQIERLRREQDKL